MSVDPTPGSRLTVGRVGRAHGLRGEVAVTLTSNRAERLESGARLYVEDRTLEVVAARPHQKRWLVCFAGIEDRTAAEALLGATLLADPLPDAPDGEVWIHELIGSEVVDTTGTVLGTVSSVEANPAHDLIVLNSGGLVPMVFVTGTEPGRVVVDPPEGLLEINAKPDAPDRGRDSDRDSDRAD